MMVAPQIPAGPFTFGQARKLGISRHRLDRMVAEREVIRVLNGVYQSARLPDTLQNRLAALALVVKPFAVVTDRTAAWLWGVDTFEFRELEILPPIEVFVLSGHHRVTRSGCRGGERDLARHDYVLIDGVLVTTPLRTALDLGCRLGRRAALAALDAFMRICGVSLEEMYRELVRFAGRRGVVQLRELIPLADPDAESPGESWTRMEIIDAGIPAPKLQFWVKENGRDVFRLDMSWPAHRVCVEYDGREFHEGEDRESYDAARRKWLRDRGWTVIVVTKDDFKGEALDAWLLELREALRLVF
jgi:hypothetical protein